MGATVCTRRILHRSAVSEEPVCLSRTDMRLGGLGKWVGILIGIIAVYRLFGWIALVLRRT